LLYLASLCLLSLCGLVLLGCEMRAPVTIESGVKPKFQDPNRRPDPPPEHAWSGQSLEQLKARLGKPQYERKETRAPDFGPYPSSLQRDESCLALYYPNLNNENVYVFLVDPATFQRIRGRNPGSAAYYVLEVSTYPVGAVF